MRGEMTHWSFQRDSPREQTRKNSTPRGDSRGAVSPMVRWHLQHLLLYREVLAISFFDLKKATRSGMVQIGADRHKYG